MAAIENAKLKLKAKAQKERYAGIAALAKLGEAAASADYDLCVVIAFDPLAELRKDALEALENIRPGLHALAVTLTLPPEMKVGRVFGSYLEAIPQLPSFKRAGLPLIAAQLQGHNPHLAKSPLDGSVLLPVQLETLGKIAREDETALGLLWGLPDSRLAAQSYKSMGVVQGSFLDVQLRKRVGEHLLALGNEKPQLRKKLVPYFVPLLQTAQPAGPHPALAVNQAELRMFGVNALASLGADADSALSALRMMKMDPSEQVRSAVREAIAKIEQVTK